MRVAPPSATASRLHQAGAASAAAASSDVPHKTSYLLFVLLVLIAANILNYADRAILSVLADPIKTDLRISNAQLGFMAGTSFVVFNAIIGLAMGRVGDRWRRNRLLMFGIGLWSVMTLFSGLSATYPQLVLARIGIGIGEATIGAIGYSMLAELFPLRWRAVVFSLFLCGPFLGVTLSYSVGGWLVQNWGDHCGGLGLCGLKGWQAAFIAFGAPGVVVAALAGMMGERSKERIAVSRVGAGPIREGLYELSLLVAPFASIQLWRLGGRRTLASNLVASALIVGICTGLIWLTGGVAQWVAVGAAAYGLWSWCQAQRFRDPGLYRLTVGSPAFRFVILGGAMLATTYGAVSFWSVPLATRQFGMTHAEAGAFLGLAIGGGSLLGTLLGGFVADRWRRIDRVAPIYIAMIAVGAGALLLGCVLTATDKVVFVLAIGALTVFLGGWPAGIIALSQELVLPLMRGRTAALYVATLTLISGSLGPYTVGRLADLSGSIRVAMSLLYVLLPLSLLFLLLARRRLSDAFRARDAEDRQAAP
jgi:MFS family permease